MKLKTLRISNFQSFGSEPVEVLMDNLTFLIGPNGSGKTVVLQALCRLFAFNLKDRHIIASDFHVPDIAQNSSVNVERSLWIEAEFEFPELLDDEDEDDLHAIPPNFAHMRLANADGPVVVRFRLEAKIDTDGEIEEALNYVLEMDENKNPVKMSRVPKQDRNNIHVHYLPARRDPSDHISYATNSLLGRTLRSINWSQKYENIKKLTTQISSELSSDEAISSLSDSLTDYWVGLHSGKFYADPQISFLKNEMDSLLRHLSVGFSPGHSEEVVDFSRLSDGQKSLLYLSLVLSVYNVGKKALSGESDAFDLEKLRPAVFTFVAMEEPENSLSPHYLGRIIKTLTEFSGSTDSQAAIATHAPSLLKRIDPKSIRYLRLGKQRNTEVRSIKLPGEADEAYKFIRGAVQAYPELYFSRLVVLGEGDTEEIILPRLMEAQGLEYDLCSISVVPLGGRHVNHFWRLLRELEIPFVTLLDLDVGRHGGGWGRIKYVSQQLLKYPLIQSNLSATMVDGLPAWNGNDRILESANGKTWIKFLEESNIFFSSPMDLDFTMLQSFESEYGVFGFELGKPEADTISAVLGKSYHGVNQYSESQQSYFDEYKSLFKQKSKPATHINALSSLSKDDLTGKIPEPLNRLIANIQKILGEIKE